MDSFETFLQEFKLSSLIGFGVIKVAAFACNAKGFIIARVFFLHTPPCFSNGLPNLFCQCFISRYEEACIQDWTYKCDMLRALEVNSNGRFKREHYKIALQPLKTSLLPQRLWPPNLVRSWLTMRGSHPSSHMTFYSHGLVRSLDKLKNIHYRRASGD